MVAENREDAVRRGEWREQLRDGTNVVAVAPRDVVAAKHDEIRARRADEINCRADVIGGHHRAVVNVGDESDAQAVECRRESRDGKRHLGGADMMALVGDAVRAGSGDGADRRRDHALERCAPGEEHTRLYSSG